MSIQFESEKISQHIFRITDGTDVCEYLIVGNNKAMLVDTGYGMGDLKSYIRTISTLPITVYITHGHVDHAGGAAPFQDVHMSHLDLDIFFKHTTINHRKKTLEEHGITVNESDLHPQRKEPFIHIKDREIIDLGDVHVLMVHVPGHTQGSFVPIVLEDRAAIFGDASGVGTLICLEGSSTVQDYYYSLLYLKTYESLYDTVLRQHGTFSSRKSLLDENIENCECILAGKDDHIPTQFRGIDCFWARKRDENTGNRMDGKEGNICYIR